MKICFIHRIIHRQNYRIFFFVLAFSFYLYSTYIIYAYIYIYILCIRTYPRTCALLSSITYIYVHTALQWGVFHSLRTSSMYNNTAREIISLHLRRTLSIHITPAEYARSSRSKTRKASLYPFPRDSLRSLSISHHHRSSVSILYTIAQTHRPFSFVSALGVFATSFLLPFFLSYRRSCSTASVST